MSRLLTAHLRVGENLLSQQVITVTTGCTAQQGRLSLPDRAHEHAPRTIPSRHSPCMCSVTLRQPQQRSLLSTNQPTPVCQRRLHERTNPRQVLFACAAPWSPLRGRSPPAGRWSVGFVEGRSNGWQLPRPEQRPAGARTAQGNLQGEPASSCLGGGALGAAAAQVPQLASTSCGAGTSVTSP